MANWPLTNLRAKEMERAAELFKKQREDMVENEDLFFDAKEYHNNNQKVANILGDEPTKLSKTESQHAPIAEATLDINDDQWGDNEDPIDIDLPEEMGLEGIPNDGG
mmetsp:Transcript_7397/g.12495  ORF Transcript_7397/g.12495 Transcript_7397/m.12495 type:complete len:107 (+) Transcript_7397:2478-2798(+)